MTADPIFDRLLSWMFDDALPLWLEAGPDRRFGGFIEELDFSGQDANRDFKRTRVTCRQIYVFAHAHILGWTDGAGLIADGADFLTTKAWRGPDLGFARRLTQKGDVLDPTPDLYDHAFALFAFAWAYRATKDAAYLDWANKTFDFIQTHFRHPSGQGYWHETPPQSWRQQNPHMHLLEASLACIEAGADDRYKEAAREIATLFQQFFFDAETGTLTEYFDDDWRTAPGDPGRITEPGHQFEWAWILKNCQDALIMDFRHEIEAMVAFGERFGVADGSKAVMNSVRNDGAQIDAGSRTWPNTERLKAAVALFEMAGEDPSPIFLETGGLLLDRYLTPTTEVDFPRGAWLDSFDSAGRPNAKAIPASTFYHLFLAFAEIIRVEKKNLAG